MKQITIITLFILLAAAGRAQRDVPPEKLDRMEQKLDSLSLFFTGLNEPVQISLSNASIQEFIRGIASANDLNVSVSQDLDFDITNNFSSAPVKEVFVFLCKEYNLVIDFTGSIMSFAKYVPPPVVEEPVPPSPLDIAYTNETDFLSINVKDDSLFSVAKRITQISPRNVVIAPGLENLKVSAFIKNRPFATALENFAFANELTVRETEGNFFVIEKRDKVAEASAQFGKNTAQITPYTRPQVSGLHLTTEGQTVTIRAEDVKVSEIVMAVAYELGAHYYLFSIPETKATLYIENATFDDFLSYVFSGTKYTFKKAEGIYLVGERNQERLRTTELVTLENRTVESIQEIIPAELKKDVDIKEFPDLNGLIISGSYTRIEEIRAFLRKIDLPVPVVLIDLMIVEVNKDFTVEAGLKLALGGENVPENTTGSYNQSGSGFETTMTSRTINELLRSFSGPGFINLGNLSPNFYASISALESNGIIKKKSTPKLATMNGSEASLSLGETTFYAETNNSFIGAQNPALSQGIVYKPINADLSITIKPFVSGDEQITLNVEFNQSNFTNRISPQAPPGAQTKTFSSKIRVRNGETILLGGLDEKSTERSGEGLPFLARVPVLKWIFGTNKHVKSKSQINIFIKPTVIY